MVALTRRGQDALTVLLAASAIGALSVAWAVTAPGGDAPAGQETSSTDDPGPGAETTPADATPEPSPQSRVPPAFAEDFEQGLDRWPVVGSLAITDETSDSGRRSATLTSTACRGDAYSRLIEVDAGATYRLGTAYRTDGGGGYIGVDLYDASATEVGDEVDEEWLIGDGAFPTYEDVRWRYNVDERDPGDLRVWRRYTARYAVPDGVASIRIKIEDWGCGGLPDDPVAAPVYFDRIRWTPVPDES